MAKPQETGDWMERAWRELPPGVVRVVTKDDAALDPAMSTGYVPSRLLVSTLLPQDAPARKALAELVAEFGWELELVESRRRPRRPEEPDEVRQERLTRYPWAEGAPGTERFRLRAASGASPTPDAWDVLRRARERGR